MDARSVHTGSTIETDLAIVGGGPAGISLALALASAPIRVLLLESGGLQFEIRDPVSLRGRRDGRSPTFLSRTPRLRYLGGCSNHWGGWCRPLDPVDFEPRGALAHSGWPLGARDRTLFRPRASLVEAGPFIYDETSKWANALGAPIHLAPGGVYTTFFPVQQAARQHPATHFGERYGEDSQADRKPPGFAPCQCDGLEAFLRRGAA